MLINGEGQQSIVPVMMQSGFLAAMFATWSKKK